MKSYRAAKQLLLKCQRCNRTQSVVWTKCPHCLYEQLQSQGTIMKRLTQNKVFKALQQQTKNIGEDIYEDNLDENKTDKLSNNSSPSKGYLAKREQSNNGAQKLIQNNLNIDNSQNQVNYKIDGSIGKYVIMFLILLLILAFLLWDLNVLRTQKLTEIINEVDECKYKYETHECERILQNMSVTQEWKQYCQKWKICKEKDPYSSIKMLKLVTLYFGDITSQLIDRMSSKVVGLILGIFFTVYTFIRFLDCLCLRRNN